MTAALAASLMLASCSVEVEPIIAENASFTGTIIQYNGNATRTSISYQDATTRSVIWESGDQIIVNGVKYDATPETAAPSTAQFSLHTGEEQEAQPVSGKYEAIYPTSLYDSGTGNYILPAIQTYEPGKISNSPMRAVSESSSLHFTNVCALIELTLKGTETIRKIEISNDGFALCGPFNFESTLYAFTTDETDATKTVTLDCGEGVTLNNKEGVKFLISIPERTYPSLTFKLTCTDGKVYEKTTKANISVTHSTIYAFTWTPEFADPDYFCLTANENNVKFTLSKSGSPTLNALEYRTGATGDWTDLAYGTAFPASASNGTFTRWAGVRWESGVSGIPGGWIKKIYPEGAIDGAFSIGEDKKICFSKGNLIAYLDTDGNPSSWRFPDNQYDYFGDSALNTINEYGGELDFFGFSTDKLPYGISISSTESDYNGETFVDWGKGFDDKGTWRTLSSTELNYLLTERDGAFTYGFSGLRFVKINLNNDCEIVHGLLLFPDDFIFDLNTMAESPYHVNDLSLNWKNAITYNLSQFTAMEAAGCVFLPATGQRSSTTVSGCNETGNYWTSDGFTTHFTFSGSECGFPQSTESKHFGYSIRLVSDFN